MSFFTRGTSGANIGGSVLTSKLLNRVVSRSQRSFQTQGPVPKDRSSGLRKRLLSAVGQRLEAIGPKFKKLLGQ